MVKIMGTKNLDKLRELCDYLGPRDEEIKRNEQLLRSILMGVPSKLTACIISEDMKILKLLSNCSKFECIRTPSEFRGKKISEYIDCKENLENAIKSHALAMNGGDSSYIANIDGDIHLVKFSPVKNDHGDIIGTAMITFLKEDKDG